ncbi:GNAT family N-acetyltransferase [Kribbella sp. NPDC055071]
MTSPEPEPEPKPKPEPEPGRDLDPLRQVVLLEELDQGGTPIVVAGEVVAVCRQPRGVRLGAVRADQVDELVAQLKGLEFSALEGEGEIAGVVAGRLPQRRSVEVGGVRLYRLGELTMPAEKGIARLAEATEVALCTDWLTDMAREEDDRRDWSPGERSGVRAAVRTMIDDGRLWVLEDGGRPVTMGGHRPVRRGVVRIGPVYTPPEFRRRGYGSALTARLADVLQKKAEVCLRTDLGNPYSHGVYQAIGFETVASFRRFQLISTDSPGATAW